MVKRVIGKSVNRSSCKTALPSSNVSSDEIGPERQLSESHLYPAPRTAEPMFWYCSFYILVKKDCGSSPFPLRPIMIYASELIQQIMCIESQSKVEEDVLRLQRKVVFRRRHRVLRLFLRTQDEWNVFLARLSKFPKIEISAGFWNGLSETQRTDLVRALRHLQSLKLSSPRPPFMRIGIDHVSKLLQQNPTLQEFVIAPNVTIINSENNSEPQTEISKLIFPLALRNVEIRGHLEVENVRFQNIDQCVHLERLYLMPASSISSMDSLLSKSDMTNLIQNLPYLQEVGLYTRFWKVVVDALQSTTSSNSRQNRIHTLVLRSTAVVGIHQCRSIARLISSSSSSSSLRNLQLIIDDMEGFDVIAKAFLQRPGQTLSIQNFMVDILESKLQMVVPTTVYEGLARALQAHWNLQIVVRQGVFYNYRTIHEDPQAHMILENQLNRLGRGYLYARDDRLPVWIHTLAQMNTNDDNDDADSIIRNFPISRQCGLSIPTNPHSLNLSCVYELLRNNPNFIIASRHEQTVQ